MKRPGVLHRFAPVDTLLRGGGAAFLAGAAFAACGDRPAEAQGGGLEEPSVAASPAEAVVDTARLASISPDSIYALGKRAYDRSRWDEARATWRFGLERARQEDDVAAEALYLTWLGLAAFRNGEYARAEALEREALDIERAHDLREQLPTTFNALGLIAWEQGRLQEAATWYDSVFTSAQSAGDATYHAKALVNLGLVETALGEVHSARRHIQEGLIAFRELGDVAMEARTLGNLAALERDAGNPHAALDWALQAVELGRTTRDDVGEEAALGQLASLYLLLGRHEEALATVDSALTRARAAGLRGAEAANLEILAGLHRQLGDLPRALRLYDSAHVINRSLDQRRYETGLDLYHMAEIQLALGNLDAAGRRAVRAREIHRDTGWTTAELTDLLLLAEIAELAGSPEQADEHLARAGHLAADLGLRSSRLDVALAEARIAEHRSDADRVVTVLDAVQDDLPVAGFAAAAEAAILRARALLETGELQAAEASGWRAIELVEAAGGELTSGLLRSTLTHSRAEAFVGLVEILLRQGDVEAAYVVASSATPRLHRDLPTGGDAGQRAELRRRVQQLASQVRETELYYWNPDRVAGSVERLREVHREYEQLTGMPVARPGSAAADEAFDADPIRASLRPDEVLLHYLVGDERAFAFVVTTDSLWAKKLDAPANALTTRVRLVRQLLENPEGGDATEVLEALYSDLIGWVGRLAGVDRLIVIPHGVLTYLPFAALRNPVTRSWLAEEKVLHHLPSASFLVSRSLDHGGFGELTDSSSVLAPLTATLPATRDEVDAVAAALGRSARVHVDEGATERVARNALSAKGIVHIASHAELDATNPIRSNIRLAPQAVAGSGVPNDDGRLEVREILDLRIRSPLVFLSGCETGLGAGWSTTYAVGEDFATLERGLLESGAGSVVATLWRIEDRSAADFASRFYRHLRGDTPAAAIAATQRDMMSDPHYAHPFYWAAYRVAGVGRLR